MATIRVTHDIGDLANDMAGIVKRVRPDGIKVVRKNIRAGATLARRNARRTAGKHGKHYPRSITPEMKLFGGLGAIVGEYGPEADRPQGEMSFEEGSRNQRAHRDLFKSSLPTGAKFARDVHEMTGDWFW